MRRLVYLATAKRDLETIFDFIADASADGAQAERQIAAIDSQCRKLARLKSMLGRPRPKLGAGLRSLPFKSYLIFFRCSEDLLEIVTVIHGHRDIDAIFAEMDKEL